MREFPGSFAGSWTFFSCKKTIHVLPAPVSAIKRILKILRSAWLGFTGCAPSAYTHSWDSLSKLQGAGLGTEGLSTQMRRALTARI